MRTLFLFALLFVAASATIYFQENFENGWENRWVVSDNKKSEGLAGEFKHTAGKYGDESNKGLQTGEDARFYEISAKFEPFKNEGKTLVVQYSVRNEQTLNCGGGYIKLLPPGLDQSAFHGGSDYNIMFGPDVCGSTKKVHAILNYKGDNYLINKNVYPETDDLSHMYTFVLNSDQTYQILVDGELKQEGTIYDDWDILPPKQIKDPSKSKPEDWVDEAKIPDPEATKPEGWDDIPAEIPDPEATKPEDWDDELDGEWEPPLIPNSEYKGEWKAPMIDNPDYKGPWEHPMIDNPDYFEDENIYSYESGVVGIEIWQVEAGTIFDNILVTDSLDEAKAVIDGSFAEAKEAEQAKRDEIKEKEAEEARLAAEAEAENAEDDEAESTEEDDAADDDHAEL